MLRRQTQLIYFLLSLIFHSLLIVAIRSSITATKPVPFVLQLSEPKPVAHAYAHTSIAPRSEALRNKIQAFNPKSSRSKSFRLKDFDVVKSWERGDYSISKDGAASGAGTNTDNPFTKWGSGAGEFERISDYLLMKRIHDRVEGLLFYPGVLARHQIQGTVNSRLVLSAVGSCDWSLSQISSSDPYLKVFVLHVLKKVCTQDFKKYLGKRGLTNVDLSFTFAITEHNDSDLIENEKHVIGNVLTFYRNSQQSIAEWKIGPIKGMFPIPMVFVDFSWLVEHWDNIVNDRDPIKEFEKEYGS